ncbi:UNVERIFIED_CONTAM: Metallothionein-like protein 4B [Sesamum calycinum]|uniref:Metallothionein-like protein 4B n=1 Tax=Sesamum calycinum TaxID=2727403 RepID=A0AAW2MMY4_9LAMI
MADMRGSGGGGACDNKCGCPSPCPGGVSCRCSMDDTTEHKQCACGEHCGCNPCTCSKTEVKGTGKAFCKCVVGWDAAGNLDMLPVSSAGLK